MKKIAFSDKYGLTNAVIQGRKTMTRRIIPINLYNQTDWKAVEEGDYEAVVDGDGYYHNIKCCGRYQIGEEIAIAQSYNDVFDNFKGYKDKLKQLYKKLNPKEAAWNNKMFVKASMMPHRIRITDIKVERLQDISDEDILREGILQSCDGIDLFTFDGWVKRRKGDVLPTQIYTKNRREAFAALIDRICGRGTWERNPWVFAYSFKVKHENEKK